MNKEKWLNLVKMLAGVIIPAVVPHGDQIAPFVVAGITQAQSTEGKTGAEKLKIATDIVDTSIAALNALKPGTVDAGAVHAVVAEGISTVVDTANLVHSKSVVLGG